MESIGTGGGGGVCVCISVGPDSQGCRSISIWKKTRLPLARAVDGTDLPTPTGSPTVFQPKIRPGKLWSRNCIRRYVLISI